MTTDNSPTPPSSPRGPAPDPQDFSREPQRALFARLAELGIAYSNTEHAPTHTVAESREIKTGIEGAHTKNLFMKDKKKNLVLISAGHDTALPLNQLHKLIGTQRLSFTNADLLWETLTVTPGSVTGFALMHDAPPRVRFILDAKLVTADTLNFHPLRNDMTTSISREDFLAFARATGHDPQVVDFSQLSPPPADH